MRLEESALVRQREWVDPRRSGDKYTHCFANGSKVVLVDIDAGFSFKSETGERRTDRRELASSGRGTVS
jgi:hypothetical protein